jgi:phi13 family phage major tail protein
MVKPQRYEKPQQQVMIDAKKTANIGLKALVNWPVEGTTFGPGEHMKGGRGLTKEISQEITNMFADNSIYDSQAGVKEITGELTTYSLSSDFYTNFLGFYENSNGGFSDSNATVKSAAIAFIEEFKDIATQQMTFRVNIVYDCKFTEPSIEIATTEEGVEYTELVCAYSAKISEIAKDDNGTPLSYFWFIVPFGYGIEQVLEFLSVCPLPDGELMPPFDTEPPVLEAESTTITDWTIADDGTKMFGTILTECGITATDDIDGNITAKITFSVEGVPKAVTDLVDLSAVGTTEVEVMVTDLAQNQATPITITITVSA